MFNRRFPQGDLLSFWSLAPVSGRVISLTETSPPGDLFPSAFTGISPGSEGTAHMRILGLAGPVAAWGATPRKHAPWPQLQDKCRLIPSDRWGPSLRMCGSPWRVRSPLRSPASFPGRRGGHRDPSAAASHSMGLPPRCRRPWTLSPPPSPSTQPCPLPVRCPAPPWFRPWATYLSVRSFRPRHLLPSLSCFDAHFPHKTWPKSHTIIFRYKDSPRFYGPLRQQIGSSRKSSFFGRAVEKRVFPVFSLPPSSR